MCVCEIARDREGEVRDEPNTFIFLPLVFMFLYTVVEDF
jgi:hypothetical protein